MNRLPPEGSLREALILTIWLRRQEIEVNKIRTLAIATMEVAAQAGNVNASSEAYKTFIESALPFLTKVKAEGDKKMVEMMKKETAKGPISFSAVSTPSPFADRAKKMQVPDDFRKKLQDRVIQQRARTRK